MLKKEERKKFKLYSSAKQDLDTPVLRSLKCNVFFYIRKSYNNIKENPLKIFL